ncbi:MAG: sigma-70 family RNA polymerase sigma factor [Propionicimonas sp.]|nr:sigma-70 family RNA polymerase sigma factor [Propionicimonas sp.]
MMLSECCHPQPNQTGDFGPLAGQARRMISNTEIALLTAAEERQLARTIEAGVLAEHLLASGERPLRATEAELRALSSEGRRAWEHFWLANLRLVWKLAGAESRLTGLNVDELFQEGCVALAGALQRFDGERGRFSTYAVTRIRQHLIEVGAARFGAMELSVSRAVQVRRAHGVRARLDQELGRQTGAEELAAELARPTAWARALLSHRAPVSLDSCDQVGRLADQIGAEPEQRLFASQVRELLALVPTDEAEVLRRRFGLDHVVAETRAEVAARLRVSLSTVRRLEQRGLERLRQVLGRDSAAPGLLAG